MRRLFYPHQWEHTAKDFPTILRTAGGPRVNSVKKLEAAGEGLTMTYVLSVRQRKEFCETADRHIRHRSEEPLPSSRVGVAVMIMPIPYYVVRV